MYQELDPLLHSQLRLAVMSILIGADEADFVFLKEKTMVLIAPRALYFWNKFI